jgi:uncharacterized protein YdhG (YjbR/CyaY superfamily)
MIHGGDRAEDFLTRIPEDWRKEKLLEIREIIQTYSELDEGMKYGMLAYGKDIPNSEPLFSLNAQKNYVSLYVGTIDKIDPDRRLLNGFSLGKGCIRISKTKEISETGLAEFIKIAVEMWKSGRDTGC